jgi:hypothetical protein
MSDVRGMHLHMPPGFGLASATLVGMPNGGATGDLLCVYGLFVWKRYGLGTWGKNPAASISPGGSRIPSRPGEASHLAVWVVCR